MQPSTSETVQLELAAHRPDFVQRRDALGVQTGSRCSAIAARAQLRVRRRHELDPDDVIGDGAVAAAAKGSTGADGVENQTSNRCTTAAATATRATGVGQSTAV